MIKQICLALLFAAVFTNINAQQEEPQPAKKIDWKKIDLSNRANDHFMLQYGYDGWLNAPDSISPSGFSRHFNIYMMLDKPFKGSPRFSAAFGLGLGSSNIFFTNTYVNLKSVSSTLPFTDVSSANHFDKFKLTTVFLEVPVELRLVQNPLTPDKGFKAALGVKVGTLLKSYTKGKNLVDTAGQSVYAKNYIQKESDKKFINSTKLAVTGRIGFGNISIDGSYQITSFLKQGTGPTINPWSFGITLSGL